MNGVRKNSTFLYGVITAPKWEGEIHAAGKSGSVCKTGGAGASGAAVRSGRIYNPPLRTRLRFPRRGELYARPRPGPDSRRGTMVLLAVGARIARPLATRMQSTSPIAAGVGRHAHMPPCRVHRPKVLQKPHSVPDAPCAPLRRVCSARVLPTREHGRIYNPPLRTRLRFPRRGRCPHRPARVVRKVCPWLRALSTRLKWARYRTTVCNAPGWLSGRRRRWFR